MRVELVYAPGCGNYKNVLSKLETVIAEERLPLPIELVEEQKHVEEEPMLLIDGEPIGVPRVLSCLETMRDTLADKWREMTVSQLRAG